MNRIYQDLCSESTQVIVHGITYIISRLYLLMFRIIKSAIEFARIFLKLESTMAHFDICCCQHIFLPVNSKYTYV